MEPTELETAYQQALDYIYSFVDHSLTHQQNLSPENFDLARMFALMERLGNPQQDYPSIHVAGTKGKGSVSALCAAALKAGGYRVGLYTSPHLKDFEERIQIDGQPMPRSDLVALVDAIKPHVAAVPKLTTFEITTALGFWYFARQGVKVAVLEVGLGGRLDSTNVVTPTVSVITSISLDHTFILGDTIEKIAAEKAGIIKPGVPVVLAPQKPGPTQVVAEIAAEHDAPFVAFGDAYHFTPGEHSLEGQSFKVWKQDEEDTAVMLRIPLLGAHQVENAATAYAALDVFRGCALELSDADIRTGFAQISWPARFEILQRQPPVIVDSAHNPYSMQALRETLDTYYPGRPVTLVLGVSADKDIEGMLVALLPRVARVITTQSYHPRAMDPDELAAFVQQYERPAQAYWEAADALEAALHVAGEDGLVLCTGSLFVAASFRIAWFEKLTKL
ncbi:MAG: bifunctional folylpolyglutamate synthase/dihydrofolate synthase [Anaerolineales bacterium]|nr:bifunctional folylpolyglutamate synthase/dihydrofolate synthase [Anaerolineales bacterium]